MVNLDTLYVVAGGAALLGGFAVTRKFAVRKISTKRMQVQASLELQRLENILEGTTFLGTLERIYQNKDGYRNQQEQKVEVISAGSVVLRIDPAESLRAQSYFADKLTYIKELGKDCQAHYFSLSDPSYSHRQVLYAVSFHQERTR